MSFDSSDCDIRVQAAYSSTYTSCSPIRTRNLTCPAKVFLVGRGGNQPFGPTNPLDRGIHLYNLNVPTRCSANEALGRLRERGYSAPRAPYARSGTNTGVELFGANPITQVVDVGGRSITNITELDHWFHYGRVEINVTPTGANSSSITVKGTGDGNFRFGNWLIGMGFFGNSALSVAGQCALK